MGFGLRPHRRGQGCRIVAQPQIRRNAQVEGDDGFGLGRRPGGGRRPNEIAATVKQHERTRRKALERDGFQCGGPIASIGSGHGDAGPR